MADPIQIDQIYVVAVTADRKFSIGGDLYEVIPWALLPDAHLYALDVSTLEAMLLDAAAHSYQVRAGSISDRRGLSGFQVCIGAHGTSGIVQCRKIDAWAVNVDDFAAQHQISDPVALAGALQASMRDLCDRLNAEPSKFRPSGLSFLRSLYDKYGLPLEPSEAYPPPLPEEVGKLCRLAHVGGPILHVRTTVAPYLRLDRHRAYGEAMCLDIPSGSPVPVDDPMSRWQPHRLGRQLGVVDATVRVASGPIVPLLPVLRWDAAFDRTRALHPTGLFRGAFVIEELSWLESAGLGEVVQIHKAYVFERSRALLPVIRWIRKLEPDMSPLITSKRLEHMLYGTQGRGLSFRKFASVPSYREPVVQDVLDPQTLERIRTRVSLYRMPIKGDPSLPIYEVRGTYAFSAPYGTMDRPDRSAHVTARNRIEVSKLLLWLDERLKTEGKRSGWYVGRTQVDGVDIEATADQVGDLPSGWTVKGGGARLDIHRANVCVSTSFEGRVEVEDGGLFGDEMNDPVRLRKLLSVSADPDGGPLASGRYWKPTKDGSDPRLQPDQQSEPIDFADGAFEGLGFGSTNLMENR